ncbi:acyl-CoA synthetase FdrA [Rahnella inusitata]|uniref:acyl-CoA synthetase FdrA n=1 Tax=Rahnella inusitata TaxID=58169 RepID=UPI0039AEF9FD
MSVISQVFSNMYQDSVSLMQISAKISKQPGIEQASVVMGTQTNLAQLADAGLGQDIKAGPNDLIIAVKGVEAACKEAMALARELLSSKPQESATDGVFAPTLVSLDMALERHPQINLALISVPGDYAAAEAIKALQLDMNVMLFSDNVSLVLEKQIKTLAREKNRLVMGPDCGTAIINGMPLGFANVVTRGTVGVVGASGTGVQEVTCRVDHLGAGISQALGTGGHDLHEEIGGISMLYGLEMLANDPQTKVIVLISKPPARAVAERILEQASTCGKPVVVNFLGAQPADITHERVFAATTLAEAADMAVALLNGKPSVTKLGEIINPEQCHALPATRTDIRGVFAGGTFCFESQLICQQQGFSAASNTPVSGNKKLADLWRSSGHTLIDMGDDDFTRGKPHPMIDPTLRNQRIAAEISDAHTAVLLFDLVLGYGAAAEPAAELLEILAQHPRKNCPLLVAHVCGTEADPQQRSRQIQALRNAGVLVAECNAQAALWASQIARIQADKKEAK